MKKRLISLLLAFSMMLTFLPAGAVSAFAEENTIDPEKGVLLKSGDIINDTFIEEHDGATTYQMRNAYTSGVTISASEKVTINITGNIDYNGTLFTVSNSGNVMVENNKNYTVKGGARVVSLVQGTITVNGGTYYGSSTETFLNYRYNNGVMWLNDINVITSGDNAVNNQGGEVHIKGGTYTSNWSPVIYNQTWDRYLNPGEAEQVGIMTLTDVTVESTSSGTGTGVVNSGNLTITGGKVTAPGPALNTYPKGVTTVESGDFSSTGDCAVRVYEKLYLNGGTFTAPNGSAIQSRDDSAYTEISGGTIKDSKVGVEVVNGSVDLKKTTFQGNDIDIYLQEDQVITIESSFKNAATIDCADPKDGRQLTKATETNYQKNLNLTSANAGYLVGYKTEDGKEYRCLSKEVGVTISDPEGEVKAGDPAKFTVTLVHTGSTGTGILTFGDKNGEIEYLDDNGVYQPMPPAGREIDLSDVKEQYAFRITPKNAGDQKLTAAVERDDVKLGTADKDYTVAGRVHTTVAIEGLEDAVIKEGESKDFTVKVDPKDDTGKGKIDFGGKNGEVQYKDGDDWKDMPADGLEIDLDDGAKDYKFRITPKMSGEQTLTVTVTKENGDELGKAEAKYTVNKKDVFHTLTVIGGTVKVDGTAVAPDADNSYPVKEDAVVEVSFDRSILSDAQTFDQWTISDKSLLGDPDVAYDEETFTFTMPHADVKIESMTRDASIDEGPNLLEKGAAAGTVIVGGVVLLYQGHMLGTELYLRYLLPHGAIVPQNRAELAVLLWQDAGNPEPVSTALYSDISNGDSAIQQAARWAVENDLMELLDADEHPDHFDPFAPVTFTDSIHAWKKAQERKQTPTT